MIRSMRESPRRRPRGRSALLPVLPLVAAVAAQGGGPRTVPYRFPIGPDRVAHVLLVTEDSLASAVDARAVRRTLVRIDSLLQTPAAGDSAPADVARLRAFAQRVREQGGTAFPAGPAQLALGYAVDAATDTLRDRGRRNALLDYDGRCFALGSPADTPFWQVGIPDPRHPGRDLGRLRLSGEAVATPRRGVARAGASAAGRPPLLSVTVVARTATDADAWRGALSALDPVAARRKAAERDDVVAVLVTAGVPAGAPDTVWVGERLRRRFALLPAGASSCRVEFF